MTLIKENLLAYSLTAVALVLGFAVLFFAAGSGGAEPPQGNGGDDGELTAMLSEFEIAGDLVAKPGAVTIDVMNVGSIAHNLIVVGEARTSNIESGQSEVLNVGTLAEGTFSVICDIAGHLEAGMKSTLVVRTIQDS